MTEEKFNELHNIVKAYKAKKDEMHAKIAKLKTNNQYDWWQIDEFKNDLYRDLTDAPERKKFIQESEKTKSDPEFEKYFRSAVLEHFLGIKIDPKIL